MYTTLYQNRSEDTENWTNIYLEPHDYQIYYLRNGTDKNDSSNGNEHGGMQKKCYFFYCLYLLLIGLKVVNMATMGS